MEKKLGKIQKDLFGKQVPKFFILLFLSIIGTAILLTGCGESVAKRLVDSGFKIEIYSQGFEYERIETREQFDKLKGNYTVKLVDEKTSGKYYIELEYKDGKIQSIACVNDFDECSGAYYVIDESKSAEYYITYFMQDYGEPINAYYEMIEGSPKDIKNFQTPDGKLGEKEGKLYLKDLKNYLKKLELDKDVLRSLSKENKYFRESLPSKKEIKDTSKKEIEKRKKAAKEFVKKKYNINPTSVKECTDSDYIEENNEDRVVKVVNGKEIFYVLVYTDYRGKTVCADTREADKIEEETQKYIATALGVEQDKVEIDSSGSNEYYRAKYTKGMDIRRLYRDELNNGVPGENRHRMELRVNLPISVTDLKERYRAVAVSLGDGFPVIEFMRIYTCSDDKTDAHNDDELKQQSLEYLFIEYSSSNESDYRTETYGKNGNELWKESTKITGRIY